MDPLGYGKITPVKNNASVLLASCGYGKIPQFYCIWCVTLFLFSAFCGPTTFFFDESQWLLASNRARSASRCLYWSKTRNGGMIVAKWYMWYRIRYIEYIQKITCHVTTNYIRNQSKNILFVEITENDINALYIQINCMLFGHFWLRDVTKCTRKGSENPGRVDTCFIHPFMPWKKTSWGLGFNKISTGEIML